VSADAVLERGTRTAPASAAAGARAAPIVNALTVDVEDYFQVSALAPYIARERWDSTPCRVERNVERILEMFARFDARATFFTLGWIAQRYPALVRRIAEAGHEVASHGFAHRRATEQRRDEFLDDIRTARQLLEDIVGAPVTGYRAPSFSVGPANAWAFDCIAEAGYRYSSSIYPIRHDHYGVPDGSRFPYQSVAGLMELPVATVRVFGKNWPAGGGGYFRLLPYSLSRWSLSRIHARDARPAVFYFHPWEVDPHQPRVPGVDARTRFRHYVNLRRMAPRLERLLSDFRWSSIERVFLQEAACG
jgi:polysaccharide deacetylase family protein (PEP-CTERM system associated)